MERQHNYEAEIAAIEESCTRRTAESHQLEAKVATVEQQLEGLLAQIQAVKLPEKAPDCRTLKDEVARLTQQRQQLQKKLDAEQQCMKGSAATLTSQLQELKHAKAHLQEQTKVPFILSRTELDAAQYEVAKSTKINEGLQNDLEKNESQITALTKASEQLDQQLSAIVTLQQETERSVGEICNEGNEGAWLLELQALENELAGITLEVQEEKEKQQSKTTALKKQVQDATAVLSEEKTKSDLLSQQASKLKTLLQVATRDAASNTQHNTAIQQLEKENQGKESVLESLKRNAERLRDQVLKEEKRIREEQQRATKQRNYKELTVQARAEHDFLAKERERHQNILDGTLRTKATYVPIKNLLFLQKELERNNLASSNSLQAKTSHCEKLQKTNKQLVQGIRRLKTLSLQAESKEERVLNELRKRGNQLTTNQLELQKEAAETAFKLNQYIKKFPNHDQDKEQKKKATMRLKKTQSIMSDIPTSPPMEKKEEVEQFIILDDEMPELPESRASQNFKKTKWYKRRSSHDLQLPDVPLYQNRYFQAAVLLFFLLFLAIFSL